MTRSASRALVAACAVSSLLAAAGPAAARVGDLAPEFNGGQPVYVAPDSSDPNSSATLGAVAKQRDRKLVVAGTVSSATSRCAGCERPVTWVIRRYLLDGRLDPAFGDGGVVTVQMEPMTLVTALLVQPSDQRILIGGSSGWRQHFGAAFVRLNPDGSLDTSFAGGGRLYLSRPEFFIRESGAMALDSSGNAYLAVSGEGTEPCCPYQGAIASVTRSGAPNPWAPSGVLIPDTERVGDQRVTFRSVAVSGEKVFYAGNLEDPSARGHALLGAVRRADGTAARSFASDGLLTVPETFFGGMLLGSDGKLKTVGTGATAGTIASYETSGADPRDDRFGRDGRATVGPAEGSADGVGGVGITEQSGRLFVPALGGVDAVTGAPDTRLGPRGYRPISFGTEPLIHAMAAVSRFVALVGSDGRQGVLAVVETLPRPGVLRARAYERRLRDGRVRVRVAGRLSLPSGVTRSEGCHGAIAARFVRAGRVVRRRQTRLSPGCRYSLTATFASQRVPARVAVRFLGNAVVGAAAVRTKV